MKANWNIYVRTQAMVAAIMLVSLGVLWPCPAAKAADLIIVNALITTQDEVNKQATALAVENGRFVAVGNEQEIEKYRDKKSKVIDVGGRRLIPGLNDSHSHYVRGGRFYNSELRWDGVPSLEIGLAMIREQAKRTPRGQWVRVIGGWSPFQFTEKRMPTLAELNEAAPDTPVFVLYLYSMGFLNDAGLSKLSITANNAHEKSPPGGRYEVVDGKLTGRLLAEPDPTILYKTIGSLPPLSIEEQLNSTKHFFRELNRFGLTSAIDAGGGGHKYPTDYTGTALLAQTPDLPLRISYYLFPQQKGDEYSEFVEWIANHHLFHDGSLHLDHGYELEGAGEFLVWSAGDYENFTAVKPDITKRPRWREELKNVTRLLVSRGWPLRIHATYNESIGHILTVFEEVDREAREEGQQGFAGIRWAIDHAETLKASNIARIKALGGGVAIQNRMAFAGEYFAERYGKKAAGNAPPIGALLAAKIPVGAGSDATRVSTYNPWISIYWLVTGKSVGGTSLLGVENRLSRQKALELYTIGSAWLSQEEEVKGRIAPGQYADFAVLNKDFFTVEQETIRSIESVLTVTNGKVVYGAEEFADLAPELPQAKPAWSPVNFYDGYFRNKLHEGER
jgi:predicted amidohydrolase YtcJ